MNVIKKYLAQEFVLLRVVKWKKWYARISTDQSNVQLRVALPLFLDLFKVTHYQPRLYDQKHCSFRLLYKFLRSIEQQIYTEQQIIAKVYIQNRIIDYCLHLYT